MSRINVTTHRNGEEPVTHRAQNMSAALSYIESLVAVSKATPHEGFDITYTIRPIRGLGSAFSY